MAPGSHKCPDTWSGVHRYSDLFVSDLMDSLEVLGLSLQDTPPLERGSPRHV